ncbi:MAG: hypothetical protein WCK49_05825, partial [Myxococcaceae bacterium]
MKCFSQIAVILLFGFLGACSVTSSVPITSKQNLSVNKATRLFSCINKNYSKISKDTSNIKYFNSCLKNKIFLSVKTSDNSS